MATDLTALTVTLNLLLSAQAEKVAADNNLSTPLEQIQEAINKALTFGTGDLKANQIYHGHRSLAGAVSESIDLSGTFLQNRLGGNIAFTKVKAVIIWNRSDEDTPVTDAVLTVGGSTALLWFADGSDKELIKAGDFSVHTNLNAGWTVGAGTTDLLLMTADGTDITSYDIIIIGEQ